MFKAYPDYDVSEKHYCFDHNRYRIMDFGGNNICLGCELMEILIDIEYERMTLQMDSDSEFTEKIIGDLIGDRNA